MESTKPFERSGSVKGGDGFVPGRWPPGVAEQLLDKIRADNLAAGARLPSEQAMARHFGVSRTVIREAIARLKVDGLLETRKGSGAFVRDPGSHRLTDKSDRSIEESIQSLLNLIEVRRVMEAEVAALAALRRTPAHLAEIDYALRHIEEAVAAGADGVEEDARLHLAIAAATGNPHWVRLMEVFAQPIRSAILVTRANEARRADFARQVRMEHQKIVEAIAAGDPPRARAAAAEHMAQAAQRVRAADLEFWRGDGGEFVLRLNGRERTDVELPL